MLNLYGTHIIQNPIFDQVSTIKILILQGVVQIIVKKTNYWEK